MGDLTQREKGKCGASCILGQDAKKVGYLYMSYEGILFWEIVYSGWKWQDTKKDGHLYVGAGKQLPLNVAKVDFGASAEQSLN